MKSVRKIKRLFWFSAFFQFLMSASILLMPMAVQIGQQDKKMTVLIGLMFWISMITAYVLLGIANSERKWFLHRKVGIDAKMNCRPGIVEFFTNIPATVADVAMILSFLLFVIVGFTDWKYEYISYILLFIFVFSLQMHCMFNGRIYKVTKFKRARRESSYE